MQLTLRETVLITITCVGITLASTGRAAHATNFLNSLHAGVTNRLANTNLSPAQLRGLRAANNILNRNSKTLGADLGLLASAAATLNARFSNDVMFATLQNNALSAYFAEAHALRAAVTNALGTNTISRGLRNQLQSGLAALQRADDNTNNVTSRARALATAFSRLRIPAAQILSRFTVPFEAPTEIATGRNLTLWENAIVNDQNIFYLHTLSDTGARYLNYSSHNPEELGTWTYERLTPKTAVVHCQVTFTQAGATPAPYSHDMALTFTSATTGTFSGVNCLGEHIQGTFTLN